MRLRTPREARAVAASVVERLLSQAAAELRARAGDRATARLEAELLLALVLGTPRARLLQAAEPTDVEQARFAALVGQRREHATPLAHLLGSAEFWDLKLRSDGRALVPRPDSETLIEAFFALDDGGHVPPGLLCDWGTGSGALAFVLARRRPVLALDRWAPALALAAENRSLVAPAQPVWLLQSQGLEAVGRACLAALIANPPYITAEDWKQLMPDVRDHDPRSALVPEDGDVAGAYARLGQQAARTLISGGVLLVEVGAGQAAAREADLVAAGLRPWGRRRDLGGHERVLIFQRP